LGKAHKSSICSTLIKQSKAKQSYLTIPFLTGQSKAKLSYHTKKNWAKQSFAILPNQKKLVKAKPWFFSLPEGRIHKKPALRPLKKENKAK
jgi:hypothetical protein